MSASGGGVARAVAEDKSKPIDSLDALHATNLAQDIDLKGKYARYAVWGVGVQLLVADIVFVGYGFGEHWRVPTAAIDAWLTATVVQVIGIALVITKYLFPDRANSERRTSS